MNTIQSKYDCCDKIVFAKRADEHPPPTTQQKVASSMTQEKNMGKVMQGKAIMQHFDRFDDATTS